MNTTSESGAAPAIAGHAFVLGPGHCLAIYERKGVVWVAEFHHGRGQLTDASAWFRSDFGGVRDRRTRRNASRSHAALTPEMLESIERLHRESEAGHERMLAFPRAVAAQVRRRLTRWMSRLREPQPGVGQTLD